MKFKFLIFSLLWIFKIFSNEPAALYLSWMHDPTTTMTIQWLANGGVSEVYCERGGSWVKAEGSYREVGTGTRVHVVELTGLEPDTTYAFRIEEKEYRFKTMPKDLGSIKFAVGGDAYFYPIPFRKMNVQVAKQDPDFVVMGGDIAYTKSYLKLFGPNELERWQQFFQSWKEDMVTSDGRLIPIIAVVGNHDVDRGNPKRELFYAMFAFPDPYVSYRTLDFGSYLSLILLDTGHTYSVGSQTEWLENALQAEALYKIPIYHVAAYPSYYSFEAKTSHKIREDWVPLFEKYGVKTVFENHNHCYKRTYKLKNGKVDEEGIVYFGDGAWGVPPRQTKKGVWYLAQAMSVNCFYLVTMDKNNYVIEAKTNDGKVIDSYEQ